MGEHVQPAAVRHADHDLARAGLGGELDRVVEHRQQHVEALDRELLLPEERLVQVGLERVDLGQPLQQRALLLGGKRLAVLAGLDRLAQPHALLVVGDVLDLVGDRAAVGLLQVRQRLGEGVAGHGHPEDARGDGGHQLGREVHGGRVERGVGLGRRAERVEPRREVAVHAVRLDDDVAACTAWSSARSAPSPMPGRTCDGAGSAAVTGPAPSLRRSARPGADRRP